MQQEPVVLVQQVKEIAVDLVLTVVTTLLVAGVEQDLPVM
jgi:hypothetical protein